MSSIINSIQNLINKVNASSDIKNKATDDANNILKQDFSKDNMKQTLDKVSCELPEKIINNENINQYYYIGDLAYNVFITLKKLNRYSERFCWVIANIYLFNSVLIYYFSDFIPIKEHDDVLQKIINNPINFIIKECFIGTIQLIIEIGISAINLTFLTIYSSYLILIMLNLISLALIDEEEEYKQLNNG